MNRSIVWIAGWELQKVLVDTEIFENLGGLQSRGVSKRLWEENRAFKSMRRSWGDTL